MEVEAITEILRWMTDVLLTKAVITTDSMSTLQKIDKNSYIQIELTRIYAGHIQG